MHTDMQAISGHALVFISNLSSLPHPYLISLAKTFLLDHRFVNANFLRFWEQPHALAMTSKMWERKPFAFYANMEYLA